MHELDCNASAVSQDSSFAATGKFNGAEKVGDHQPSLAERAKRAREAFARIHQNHWSDYVILAEFLGELSREALHEAGTNSRNTYKYRKAMKERQRLYGLDGIDKGDLSRLLKVADNLPAIQAWYASLESEKRCKLNHPAVVLRYWQSSFKPAGDSGRKKGKQSRSFAAAWAAASPQEITAHLDTVGRAGLCAVMSDALKGEFADRRAGLDIASADTASGTAVSFSRLLQAMVMNDDEPKRLLALNRFRSKLQAGNVDPRDLIVGLGGGGLCNRRQRTSRKK
jgi:hypothetical protein